MEQYDKQQVGKRLGQWIKTKKMQQYVLAQRIGLSSSFVSKVIKGESDITKEVLLSLAKNFPEVNLDWLLHGRGSCAI